jgi:hypothetical protein
MMIFASNRFLNHSIDKHSSRNLRKRPVPAAYSRLAWAGMMPRSSYVDASGEGKTDRLGRRTGPRRRYSLAEKLQIYRGDAPARRIGRGCCARTRDQPQRGVWMASPESSADCCALGTRRVPQWWAAAIRAPTLP